MYPSVYCSSCPHSSTSFMSHHSCVIGVPLSPLVSILSLCSERRGLASYCDLLRPSASRTPDHQTCPATPARGQMMVSSDTGSTVSVHMATSPPSTFSWNSSATPSRGSCV